MVFIQGSVRRKKERPQTNKIEDGAISPSSITAYVALITASVGGLWLAFSVGVSGSLDLQQLSLDLAKTRNIPSMDIELNTSQLSQAATKSKTAKAVQFSVAVKNKGPKRAKIDLHKLPLLVISKIENGIPGKVDRLPYRKIECPQDTKLACIHTEWKSAEIEPDGAAYYHFLHEGLDPGIYLAQFSIPVDKSLVT
jgi:hypothetical protein